MDVFIAGRIMLEAEKSIEQGKSKYRAYFISISIYQKYKADVDATLSTEGYEICIVSN